MPSSRNQKLDRDYLREEKTDHKKITTFEMSHGDVSFADLLFRKKFFINRSNRYCAWERRQWDDLWSDMLTLIGDSPCNDTSDNAHSNTNNNTRRRRASLREEMDNVTNLEQVQFGHIVLRAVSKEQQLALKHRTIHNDVIQYYEIVDGQQRIVTILILLSVICHRLKKSNDMMPVHESLKSLFKHQMMAERTTTYPIITFTSTELTEFFHMLLIYGLDDNNEMIDESANDASSSSSSSELAFLDRVGSNLIDVERDEASEEEDNKIYDLRDERVKELKLKYDKDRFCSTKSQLVETFDYFSTRVQQLLQSYSNSDHCLLDLDAAARNGFRFTFHIIPDQSTALTPFCSRGKPMTSLERTKHLFLHYATRLKNNELAEMIESTWDFIHYTMNATKLLTDYETTNFLAHCWTASFTGCERHLDTFHDIERNYTEMFEAVVQCSTATPRPSKRRKTSSSRRSDADMDYFVDTIKSFAHFLKQTIPIYCMLRGKHNIDVLSTMVFGEEKCKELYYLLLCIPLTPWIEEAIPVIMAAHFSCVWYEGCTYRSVAYADKFYQFLLLLKTHLLFWDTAHDEVGHLDNLAVMLFHGEKKDGTRANLSTICEFLQGLFQRRGEVDVDRFVTQSYCSLNQEKATRLFLIEYRIEVLTSEVSQKIELFSEYITSPLGHIIDDENMNDTLGNLYFENEPHQSRQSVTERNTAIKSYLIKLVEKVTENLPLNSRSRSRSEFLL